MEKIFLYFFSCVIVSSLFSESACFSQTMEAPHHGAEVRIFADRGFVLPNGRRGTFIQIYGVHIEQDGSEKVLWRRLLNEVSGFLEAVLNYEYLYFDDLIYLYFPSGLDFFPKESSRSYLKLNRQTGEIIRWIDEKDDEVKELRMKYQWYSGVSIVRPAFEKTWPSATKGTNNEEKFDFGFK